MSYGDSFQDAVVEALQFVLDLDRDTRFDLPEEVCPGALVDRAGFLSEGNSDDVR